VSPTRDQLRALPKVDLHVHLEGAVVAQRIAELATAAGQDLPRPVHEILRYDDEAELVELLEWIAGLVKSKETAAALAYEFAQRATADGVVYAEVTVSPVRWGVPLLDLTTGLAAGFDRAAGDGLCDCRILLSVLRRQSADAALDLADFMAAQRPGRVVGIAVEGVGEVAGRWGRRFMPAYATAREAGFGLTAHAGEHQGPESILDALDLLRVDRVDHGVRAMENPVVVARLVESGTTLNVCVSANCRSLYGSLAEHPLGELLLAGVPCTLGTEYPVVLRTSLTDEFEMVGRHFGWSLAEVAKVTRTGIAAAFCDDAHKARMGALLNRRLAGLTTAASAR
jgi:adenosine deaminase